jgi:DNA-binding CsgD family transcriptional regulator
MDTLIRSQREKRLLRRLARGYSDHAIASQIGGRADQVGEQRKRLLQKLQISSQSEIAEAAARWAFWPSYLPTVADEDGGHDGLIQVNIVLKRTFAVTPAYRTSTHRHCVQGGT